MKRYLIYIKSHSEAPDYENEVRADSRMEAVERFYEMLRGEFDREFILANIMEVDDDEEN